MRTVSLVILCTLDKTQIARSIFLFRRHNCTNSKFLETTLVARTVDGLPSSRAQLKHDGTRDAR